MLKPARTLLRTPWLTVTVARPVPHQTVYSAARSIVFVLWGEYTETSTKVTDLSAEDRGMRLIRFLGLRRIRHYYQIKMIQLNTLLLVFTGRKHDV